VKLPHRHAWCDWHTEFWETPDGKPVVLKVLTRRCTRCEERVVQGPIALLTLLRGLME
jgi:hypothetical protein